MYYTLHAQRYIEIYKDILRYPVPFLLTVHRGGCRSSTSRLRSCSLHLSALLEPYTVEYLDENNRIIVHSDTASLVPVNIHFLF